MTNNDKANHLKGHLGPPLVTKNDHFLKLCDEGQLDHPVSTFSRNASWPDNPRSAARRAAQDLVSLNNIELILMSKACPRILRA